MERKAEFFTSRFITYLIIPLFIEQLLTLTIGMADTIMVSSVGEGAISGIALVDSISNLFIQLFSAFATGGAVVASQYLGREDKEKACMSANQLIIITAIVSIFITSLGLIGNKGLLLLLFGSIEADVMQHAYRYFILILLSYPFLAIINSINALCRSMGKSNITLYVSFVINLLNILGNYIFIYIFKLGSLGAGLASLISRLVGMIIMLIIISNKSLDVHIDNLFKTRLVWPTIKRILRIGLPSGIENSIFHIGKVLVQSLVATFGTASIAAWAVVNNINGFANLPGGVLGLASITIIGQCCGASKYNEARKYARRLLILSYILMAASCLIFYISTPLLTSLFNLSEEARELSIFNNRVLLILTAIIWPVSFTLPNYLRAAGDVKFTMLTSIFGMWSFRISLAYVLALFFDLGIFGAYMAMVCDWIFRSILFITRWHSGKWQRARVI